MAAPKETAPYIVGLVLDFETGGIPKKDLTVAQIGITQIALHAIRLDTFEKIGSFVKYVYPYEQKAVKALTPKRKTLKSKYDVEAPTEMVYGKEALEFTAITMDMLREKGVDINELAQDVLKFIEGVTAPKTPRNMKPIIIGQNITFDEGFLIQMFEFTGLLKELMKLVRGWVDFYGNWHPQMMDTLHLGQLALCHNPNITSYSLGIMCENLGIELDDAHDADADVTATTNVVAILTQRMRSVGGSIEDTGGIQMNKAEKSRKHFKI